ncbi:FG-GAP-like repeat-containing protein [Tenacibaculum xiamenense]|uniref:FG-GAP-like repeat-containing protein n=1 Tax=Tenacibaculum xiamenense TaxID=1261553 RepID=UPI0038B5E552
MKKVTLFLFFIYHLSFSQVNFTGGQTLIDKTTFSNNVSALASADLNNNGFKEIIVGSYYDNKIVFYKNINGNIQHYQREVLEFDADRSHYSEFDIICKDLNKDGFTDIIVTNSNTDIVYWYKNLGSYNFSSKIIIDDTIDKPSAILAEDIDKDGDIDLIVGSNNDDNVSLFTNDGNNNFTSKRVLFNTSYGVTKIKLADLDNNGFLDIISGNESGGISWVKNIDGINFGEKLYLAGGSGEGFDFDFFDIDNDGFLDVFLISNYDDNITYQLNENGNSFSYEKQIIGNTIEDFLNFKIVDLNKDGFKDIVATTKYRNDKLGWFQQNEDGTFTNFKEISSSVKNVKYLLIEDLENDGDLEIITASYKYNDAKNQKIATFKYNSTENSYKETIIDFYIGAANVVKIVDLDNDGKNDIVSGFQSIVWNKNQGDNIFSSHILISEDITGFITDLQFTDFNSDGFIDIIASAVNAIEIYENKNGVHFEFIKNIDIDKSVEHIELSDVNGDNLMDIVLSHSVGTNPISVLFNDQNFNFLPIKSAYTATNGNYKAYSFKCGDMDADGDNDIVVGERDNRSLIWLENDGTGNFEKHIIANSIACDDIDLGDVDNNSTLDIVASGDNDYGNSDFNFFKNNVSNETGLTFEQIKIDVQSLQSVVLADINNDNYLDIIGTSCEAYSPFDERIFYYLNNGNLFENAVNIESLGEQQSLDKNAALGDLNNDGKLDIVSSYYFTNSIKYFLNDTTLSTENFISKKEIFKIFPNPSNHFISWDTTLKLSLIEIYNPLGKRVYKNANKLKDSKLKIDFLSKGLYFIKAIDKTNNEYSTKLIIK